MCHDKLLGVDKDDPPRTADPIRKIICMFGTLFILDPR